MRVDPQNASSANDRTAATVGQELTRQHLKEAYRKSGLVLVLGAGLSVDSGVPTWEGLLDRVAHDLIGSADLGELRRAGVSFPVIATILQELGGKGDGLSKRDAFIRRIREALYRTVPFVREWRAHDTELVSHVQENNLTLRAVGAFCASRDGRSHRYVANPRVRAIVNFNLDVLLREFVQHRYRTLILRTIERASASSTPGKIGVYHMHGHLRFDEKAGDPRKEAPDAVVLTEQDYFDTFNDPTGLFSYTFMFLLREHSCLFVGSSMQDENIRRLLHYSRKERWMATRNEDPEARMLTDQQIDRRVLRHFAMLRRSGVPAVDAAIERSLLPLGTSVVWVDSFHAIPDELRAVYDAAGDWELVY